jgi:hypothetical protein
LVAGDFFIEREELRHVPRISFANFTTNVLGRYVFRPGELHYSTKSKAVHFQVPIWYCYFIFEFFENSFLNI